MPKKGAKKGGKAKGNPSKDGHIPPGKVDQFLLVVKYRQFEIILGSKAKS
jgi:hypothetical protein